MQQARFFDTSNAAVAVNWGAASSGLARAVIAAHHPEIESLITTPHGDGNGTAYPEGKTADNVRWQATCPKVDPAVRDMTLILVRDPIEKFRSACSESGLPDVENVLTGFGAILARNSHFWPQSRLLLGETVSLYRFPDHLEALAQVAGLAWPLPDIQERDNRPPKPTLTAEQEQRVRDLYAEDVELFDSITAPGQITDRRATDPDDPTGPIDVVIPQEVEPRQIRLALLRVMGIKPGDIAKALEALPEEQHEEAMIEWDTAMRIPRGHELVAFLMERLGKTSDEVDQLFLAAEQM